MDALGENVLSTVNRALVRVFRCPCPLLGGDRSRCRWACKLQQPTRLGGPARPLPSVASRLGAGEGGTPSV
eukprot:2363720-Prymnesium_polylepis.1